MYVNINKRLGEGASGTVYESIRVFTSRYKGTDAKTKERIALKVAPASDIKNLKNELALQRMCHHENIVALRDCFLWNDKLWVGTSFLFNGRSRGS